MFASAFSKKNEIVFISLLIFLANFLLKILFVSHNEIAMDEPFSLYYAQMDLPSIFTMLKTENNPALHFIVLHFWIKLFGISAFSVRFLSVVFSALTAVVVFLIGNKFFSKQIGIIAALIFTLSLFHVYFSHEARVYPLFIFLTTLSLYYFLSIVSHASAWKPYIALFMVNLLLIYAHYFGFFVLAAEFLSIFFIGNFRQIWKKMLGVFILLAVSYSPNIIIFLQRFTVSVQHGTWVRKPEVSELYGNLNRFLNSRTVMFIFILIGICYFILLLRKQKLTSTVAIFFNNPYARVLVVWFVFPYLAMFLLSFWAPMFLDRYIIYISIPFYLLIAVFIGTFTEHRNIRLASTMILLLAMAFYVRLAPDNNRRVDDVVKLVNELKAKDTNTLVIISPEYSYLEYVYHYKIDYFKDYKNTLSLLHSDHIYPASNLSSFDKSTLSANKVVYLDCGTDFAIGKNPILDELKTSHILVKSVPIFEIYSVYWFHTKP